MKISWGTGIVIAIILFIGFIMSMVYQMTTNKKYDHDLVTKNYYQKELEFQESIDASQNATSFSTKITLKKVNEGLKISFPKEIIFDKVKGSILLYRPSNKKLDFQLPIKLNKDNEMIIPEKNLVEGRWDISTSFDYNNKKYLDKQSLKY